MFDNSLAAYQKSLLYQQTLITSDYSIYLALVRVLIVLDRSAEALSVLQKKIKTLPQKVFLKDRELNKALGYCYNALNQFDKAEKYYLEAIRIDDRMFVEDAFIEALNYEEDYNDIAEFYISRKQYKKAGDCLTHFMESGQRPLSPIGLSRSQLSSFKIDSAAGNYFSAIKHFEQYKSLQDSLYNVTKSKQVAELQIQYETVKKEKAIAFLERRDQANKATLQRFKLLKKITLTGIGVLLIIIALVYNSFRLKKSSNIALQAQQTEINTQNVSLQNLNRQQKLLLDEKEWLLREVHHRVKNNMQTTMSLLNMQTSYLSNPDAIDAIRNSQRRMYAMSIVHQKLYQSENLATIEMQNYVQELIGYLKESFAVGDDITFELQLQPIELDLALAIPVGLIINEVVTNAIKYAFPGKRRGHIMIGFERGSKDTFSLCVADNGIGVPDSLFFGQGNSLGLNLIKGLTDQIQGQLEVIGAPGMSLRITFKNIKEERA
jgi:two-component sensor histidine kinase